jgi:hypothetical protein
MRIKDLVKIYIIESTAPKDFLDNREEGFALSEILQLAEIKNKYWSVVNRECFEEALDRALIDFLPIEKDFAHILLHFSMHGNKDGVGFTNGEFLKWEEFSKIINDFNNKLGYIKLPKFTGSKVQISMSSCQGFNAAKIQEFYEDPLYTTLIGPVEAVNWSDSLMAFAALYHNTLHKESTLKDSIIRMNTAAGLDNIYNYSTGKNLTLK